MDIYDELKLLQDNARELEVFADGLSITTDREFLIGLAAKIRVNIETVKAAAEEYDEALDDELDGEEDEFGCDLDDDEEDEDEDDEDEDA